MVTFDIEGGQQFAALAERLREAANGDLQRELYAAVNKSARPLIRDARASALENLPKEGGLDKVVASSRFSVVRRVSGITIKVKGIDQLALTNRGGVKHPVYGKRRWVFQKIPKAKDWFFNPMRAGADDVRRNLIQAMHKVAEKIT